MPCREQDHRGSDGEEKAIASEGVSQASAVGEPDSAARLEGAELYATLGVCFLVGLTIKAATFASESAKTCVYVCRSCTSERSCPRLVYAHSLSPHLSLVLALDC